MEEEMLPQNPETLYNQMSKFKSGEIYEFLLKGSDGNFLKHSF